MQFDPNASRYTPELGRKTQEYRHKLRDEKGPRVGNSTNSATSNLYATLFTSNVQQQNFKLTSGITGGWQVIAARYTKTAVNLFVDGTKNTSTGTYSLTDRTVTNSYIGKSWWTAYDSYANLDIREFMVFDDVLTDSQIDAIRVAWNTKYA